MASEPDRRRVLASIRSLLKPVQLLFVGVTDPINARVESPEEVLEAAELIPLSSLGTTDDCGFSPFADDTSSSRETAFAKMRGPRILTVGEPFWIKTPIYVRRFLESNHIDIPEVGSTP